MNVLNPLTIRVGNRQYRVESSIPFPGYAANFVPTEEPDQDAGQDIDGNDGEYNDDQPCKIKQNQSRPTKQHSEGTAENNEFESDEFNFEVQTEKDGRFSTRMSVFDSFIGVIIGKKGDTKRDIEKSTLTELRLPPKRSSIRVREPNVSVPDGQPAIETEQHSVVTILGQSKRNLASARCRIEQIVERHKRKLPFTHFLSVPLNYPTIMQRASEFKRLVLDSCLADRGVDESLFMRPAKLHITLSMLVLADAEEQRAAKRMLEEYTMRLRTLLHGKLRVRVRGLEIMNDDPNMVDVLFAKVQCLNEPPTVLQTIANEVVDRFSRFRFREDFRLQNGVRLHVTIMNSKLRNELEPGDEQPQPSQQQDSRHRRINDQTSTRYDHRSGSGARESFDAANILQNFGNFDFGEVEVDCLELSRRFHLDENGHYAHDAVLKF